MNNQKENNQRLVCVVMGQNCERFIGMCLESVKEADEVIYCDGGSTDETLKLVDWFRREFKSPIHEGFCVESAIVISNKYDQEDKAMNGKQRNFYLDYIKKNYSDWWCLVLDADEVVEDLNEVKKFIQTAGKGVYSVKMRHLIQDLMHEDSTVNTHFVPNRLFKIECADKYPEVEHPVLIPNSKESIEAKSLGGTICTTIWHLAYIPNLWEIKKRYENHLKKSNMHSPEFLKSWYYQHLFGTYPKKEFNPIELPKEILKEFGIDRDELYFANRGIEVKHFIDVFKYMEYFNLGWLKNVNVDVGK